MNERERLIRLLEQCSCAHSPPCTSECSECNRVEMYDKEIANIADYLLANGVTVQRWIPVTERLPDTIPYGAGMAYSEAVNVLTTGRKVLTAIWDGMDFIADAEFWAAEGEEITHWASVPLPLPEPPKEE